MISKVIIALLLFSGGTMIEHTVTDGVKDCLEKKRMIERNMKSETAKVSCVKVEAQIETIEGIEFIRSIGKIN